MMKDDFIKRERLGIKLTQVVDNAQIIFTFVVDLIH